PGDDLTQMVSALKPGDTLVLRDGVYDSQMQNIPSGSPGNPITIRSENPGGAIIRPTSYQGTGIIETSGHDIVINGLTTDGRNLTAPVHIYIHDGADVVVANNDLGWGRDNNSPSNNLGIAVAGAERVTITHNRIHDMGYVGYEADITRSWGSYGMYFGADNSIIEYNEIYNNSSCSL